jgi:nicotinamidase-related amidase
VSTLDRRGGTALLLIDLQVDVLGPCTDADQVVARTAHLLDRARTAGVPVVHVQHSEPGLEPGTAGWPIVEAVRPAADEPVVHKRYRDSFAGTDLAAVLADLDVDRLVIAACAPPCTAQRSRVTTSLWSRTATPRPGRTSAASTSPARS